ncbi:MAG: ATP-binding protein [Geminicoccaceae bacterium]
MALRDIKRYGFARRPDGTVVKSADLEDWGGDHDDQADRSQPPQNRPNSPVQYQQTRYAADQGRGHGRDQSEDAGSPGSSGSPFRGSQAKQLQAVAGGPAVSLQSTRPAAPGEPEGTSPHIEQLRREFGDDMPAGWTVRPTPQTIDDPGPSAEDHRSQATADGSLGGKAHAPDMTPASHIADMSDMAGGAADVADEADQDLPPAADSGPGLAADNDCFDDVAVTIGRVVSICGSVVWGALFDDIDGQASKAARMGALVSMRGSDSRVFGIVNRLEREQQAGSNQAERTIFEIQILGEIADSRQGFQRGVSSYPPLDAPITTVTLRDIATIYARPKTSNVHIGRLRHNQKVPAFVLTDSLLGKHFAVLGTTGTGKSCATTVILRSILDEHPLGHVVLLDPHNEYGPAFADRAELLNPRNLQLPYWLLNFEEIAQVLLGNDSKETMSAQSAILKDGIIQAKKIFAGEDPQDNQITVDTPIPYRLSDLVSTLKEGMGMLNKADGATRYLGVINRIESIRADKRYAFMFSSLMVRDNMEQVLAQLLRIPTKGKPITIIDISGLPSEIVDVVVSVLFRLTFELAVWSERGKAPPVLLVCEEAHRYVPEESDVGFAPTKRVIGRIAKEGRKYGVTLCLVSQRPSELDVNALAQCNTIFALRLSNEHDQAFVARSLPENARWLVDSLPSLNTQEAVVVGDGVTVPVHIRFNELKAEHRPASHDPSFAKSWCSEADDSFLGQAIDRWRRQAR